MRLAALALSFVSLVRSGHLDSCWGPGEGAGHHKFGIGGGGRRRANGAAADAAAARRDGGGHLCRRPGGRPAAAGADPTSAPDCWRSGGSCLTADVQWQALPNVIV